MSESSLNLPVIWKWGKRVGFSILDQGLFSGSNFALNILLARWLSPEEYGAFAVSFSIMWILGGIQSSLIYEPMMVFGPIKFQGRLPNYIKQLSRLQLIINIPLSVLVVFASLFMSAIIKTALIGMAITLPFIMS